MRKRVVFVTGGTRGIGFAIASRFLHAGDTVAICGRSSASVKAAEAELEREPGGTVIPIVADVSQPDDVASAFALLASREAFVDVLVNNAGTVTFGRLADLPPAAFDSVFGTNVRGAFLCSVQMGHYCDEVQRPGVIVNIASQAGKRAYPYVGAYCASKAALLHLSRTFALEMAPLVRVNSVCPGVVLTDMIRAELEWRHLQLDEKPETVLAAWRAASATQRLQSAQGIAEATFFLASDAASDIVGEAINVSGGMVMD